MPLQLKLLQNEVAFLLNSTYLNFEVDTIMVFLVGIVNIPISPLPERGGHFV